MKFLKNRWFHLILALVAGAFLGADWALRYAHSRQVEYSQELEDFYINARISRLNNSLRSITHVEDQSEEKLLELHRIEIRAMFLTLVDLHQSRHYADKENEMQKALVRAKQFMVERPEAFLNRKFYSLKTVERQVTDPTYDPEPAAARDTELMRDELQAAYDYVDALPSTDGK